jgi:hypothetical protein
MPREKGKSLESTNVFKNNINDYISTEPRTYAEIAAYFDCSYKTAWKYVQDLITEGRAQVSGRRGGADLVRGTVQKNIPTIPSPEGPVNPLRFVYRIFKTQGHHKTKIAQLEEKWPITLAGIFRSSVVIQNEGVFPEERHKEYETYLKIYREELALRLAQINAFLQTPKFWSKEGLTDFHHDPAYSPEVILGAYQFALQPGEKKD